MDNIAKRMVNLKPTLKKMDSFTSSEDEEEKKFKKRSNVVVLAPI